MPIVLDMMMSEMPECNNCVFGLGVKVNDKMEYDCLLDEIGCDFKVAGICPLKKVEFKGVK